MTIVGVRYEPQQNSTSWRKCWGSQAHGLRATGYGLRATG